MKIRTLILSLMTLGLVALGFAPFSPMAVTDVRAQSESETHVAVGTVKEADTAGKSVTISHGPVQSLDWPAMTMTFGVQDKSLLIKLAKGEKVEFEFVKQGGAYTIVNVQ